MISFPPIDSKSIENLNETTNQVHYAAQYLAAAGVALVKNKDGDSHTNMSWHPERGQFMGQAFADMPELHLALQVDSLELQLHNTRHEVLQQVSLVGKTQEEGLEWLKEILGKRGLKTDKLTLDLHYDLPDHDLANGAKFKALNGEGFSKVRTLGNWALKQIANDFDRVSDIRTWPHHFDHGAVITVASNDKNEAVKTIGIGLAIHEKIIPESYFYVTHWAKGADFEYSNLPDLPGPGYWNRENWTGAVLKISDIARIETSKAQQVALDTFMHAGITATMQILNQEGR